jgi:hypothetical protein
MKKHNFFIILFLYNIIIHGYSQDTGFGIGIIIGEPTGISAKLWMTGTSALDLGAAWSFLTEESEGIENQGDSSLRLAFHLDYLFHFLDLFEIPGGNIAAYIGGGGRIKILDNGIILGARVPLGLDYFIGKIPIDVFIELVPVMELYPATRVSGNGGIGIRYFFLK